MHLDLNLKQVKVFYYVAKHLSLTRAAEELFVTQPAVAMQVKSLEAHLQTALFIRRNNKLELSEAGSLLFPYAERMMQLAFEAEQALLDLKQTPGTILRIGTTKTWARYLMPSYILLFQKQNPGMHIQLDDGSSEEMMATVLAGRNHLAIIGRVAHDPGLEFLPFPGHETDELMLCVPPSHHLAGRREVRLKELEGEPFILRQRGSGTRHTIDRAAEELGVQLHVLLEAGSPEFIKDLVRKGVGVSILTYLSIEEEIRRGNLAGISLAEGGLHVNLDIVLPKEGFHRPAVRTFLHFLEQQRQATAAGAIAPAVET